MSCKFGTKLLTSIRHACIKFQIEILNGTLLTDVRDFTRLGHMSDRPFA